MKNENDFLRYLTGTGILGNNSIFSDLLNELKKEEEKRKEEQKKQEALLPLQLTPAELSDSYKKKFCIDGTFQYPCHITFDGKKLSDEYFCYKNDNTSNVNVLNHQRYIVLKVLKEEKYAKDIMKMCQNKNPWHLQAYDCIVECATGKIHYTSSEQFCYSAVQLYNNVCVDANKKIIQYLPNQQQAKYVGESYSSFATNEIGRYLFITKKYGGDYMYRLDTITGEVCNMLDEQSVSCPFEKLAEKLFDVTVYD